MAKGVIKADVPVEPTVSRLPVVWVNGREIDLNNLTPEQREWLNAPANKEQVKQFKL